MRIALPASIDPAAVRGIDPAMHVLALAGETMGTTWRTLLAVPARTPAAPLQQAIEARLAGLVAEMSHWDAGSILSRFNRAAAGEWVRLPPDFAQVTALALEIAEASGGRFDPTIGRIVDLWGFGPSPAPCPPDPAALSAAAAASGWRRLSFDPAARRLRQPGGLALDLSGIAKGHAADALADLLAGRGHRHCLVEVGGELVGRGLRPDGEPWWVDLETPPGAVLPPLRIALHGLAVATSGNYRRGDHSIDPRTAAPARNGVTSVSVIAATAAAADAWASALTVLGAPAGVELAEALGLAARFVVGGSGAPHEILTGALAALLHD